MFDYAVDETNNAENTAAGAEEDFGFELSGNTQRTFNSSLTVDEFLPLNDSSGYESPFNSGVLNDVVSIKGLEAMIISFFGGIGEYSQADVESLFSMVDTDGSGCIDRDEFDQFMALATQENYRNSRQGECPWCWRETLCKAEEIHLTCRT